MLKAIDNGSEALEYLQCEDTPPQIVLLDYHLPGKNGIEILEAICPNTNKFSFIFLSFDNSFDTAIQVMKIGALDFVSKSANLKKELPRVIKKVYRIHDAQLVKDELEKKLSIGNYFQKWPNSFESDQ